jgi:hypothetical protein
MEKSYEALLEVVLCIPPVSPYAELLKDIALLWIGGELLNYENWSPNLLS